MDFNNFNLGKYIAFAVNDPKKYPKKPFTQEEELGGDKKAARVMTDKQMAARMKNNFVQYMGLFNKKKK